MSIASEITRITNLRNKIKAKLVEWGLVQSTANLESCANAIDVLNGYTDVSATIKEGDTYTIPRGFHNGTGTVSAVGGGGNYELQSKTVSPSYTDVVVTPDVGKYGLDSVTVRPIPANLKDVTFVTATANGVLEGTVFVDSNGNQVAGKMKDKLNYQEAFNPLTTSSISLEAGYYHGNNVLITITDDIENALAEI